MMGKPMKRIGTLDPDLIPATGGNLFSNLANGTTRPKPPVPTSPASPRPVSQLAATIASNIALPNNPPSAAIQPKQSGYTVIG